LLGNAHASSLDLLTSHNLQACARQNFMQFSRSTRWACLATHTS
jgi:hypothetical protein